MLAPRRLDLTLPADVPLTPEEQREMAGHLAFLRRHKSALRLSLNAAEDLLVNGARPPVDRGVCRHLLAKIDRVAVQKALAREPLKSDPAGRARILAGVIRIDPDVTLLLEYLETLSAITDRREAAEAFAMTVDRIDFAALSSAQVVKLLEVIETVFSGHELLRALFGLLESESFRRVLAPATLPDRIARTFAPLIAVHAHVVLGERAPEDDEDRTRLAEGAQKILDAPDAILRSYGEPVRARLCELAMSGEVDERTAARAARRLLDSLPDRDDRYLALRVARVEQALRAGEDDEARALLNKLASAHPDFAWAKKRLEAIAWPRIGRVTVQDGLRTDGRLRSAFWLDGPAFCWARTGPPERAAALVSEARLQSEVAVPWVAPILAHGLGESGRVFVAIAAAGAKQSPTVPRPRELLAALQLALEGAQLLAAIARFGVELPDLAPDRILWRGPTPLIASFAGAGASDPAAAAIAHGPLAGAWARTVLATDENRLREDLQPKLRTRLAGSTPLPVLIAALATELGRLA